LRAAPRRALLCARRPPPKERNVIVNLIANIVGALGAIAFVGFFALKVGALPLILIVALSLALMVFSFYDDMRNDREKARLLSGNGSK
jgi:hypothetical protein